MKILKKQNIINAIIAIFIITSIIVGVKQLVPKSKAEELTSIKVSYVSEENTIEVIRNDSINNDTNSLLLLDFSADGTDKWIHSDIESSYIDENNVVKEATYKASFAGWKLVSINGIEISEEYIYNDNDYIYLNDEPFVSVEGDISELKFEALWGKTVYVRDKYNFVDIQNVYGYNVDGSTGDILTAKINWDTSMEYSNDNNSGATEDEPVSTIQKAYELLKDSYGGKIYIANHLTLEVAEQYQAYSTSFTNASRTEILELGDNLNISGVVTISGKDLGSGTEVENKANTNNEYNNSFLYLKNTRGAGLYKGGVYKGALLHLRFHTNTVLEDFSFVAHRENYNSNGARQTGDSYIYGTASNQLLIEETFIGYKRTTTQAFLGLETGNWSNIKVEGIVNGKTVQFSALTNGLNGCSHVYGTTYSYTHNGEKYTVNENDNIYLTVKGGGGWYNIYGMTAYSKGTSVSNVHLNIYNITVGTLAAVYSGEISSAKEINVYINNVSSSGTVSTTCNATINADTINFTLKGNGTKTISIFYAGGYNRDSDGVLRKINSQINLKVDGAKIKNFYGGGNQVATIVTGEVNIDIESGTITNLFGGGLGGYIGTNENKTNINLTVNGGNISYIYGGGSGGFVQLYSSSSPADLTNFTREGQYFYSSKKYYATLKETYNETTTRYDDAMFIIKEYTVKNGDTVIDIYNSIYSEILYPKGGNDDIWNYYRTTCEYTISDALVNGDITINLNNGANILNDVYGGGKNGAVSGNIKINVYDGAKIAGNIYGGGEGLYEIIQSSVNGQEIMWTNSQEEKVTDISKFEQAVVKEDTVFSLAPAAGNYTEKFLIGKEFSEEFQQSDGYVYIYSKTISKLGLIDGNTQIIMYGGQAKNIYGGSNGAVASVSGDTEINIKNATIDNVYGGGNAGEVSNTIILIEGSNINNNIYGGGNVANINGNTSLTVSTNTTITGNIFGGGYSGNVLGTTTLSVFDSLINEIFGGGYSGTVEKDTEVNVISGTYTNIFGGGDQSYVKGNTKVNIGDSNNLGVKVMGLVYGGGRGYDENSDGDASDFTTVYGSSEVNIQGIDTEVENYGSVKLGAVEGEINVLFKNYWTGNPTAKYKTMNGIDRATTVTFENSYVLLENKDSEGNLEGIKSIENLVIPSGSGLKISADGEITGNFEGGGELYLDSAVCLTVGGDISGVTKLILNPQLFTEENVNKIEGGVENPYLKVRGESQATDTEALAIELVSGERRYRILSQRYAEEGGIEYSYYYIDKTIIITDYVEIEATSENDRIYNGTITNTQGIVIENRQVFTSDMKLHYELLADESNVDKYENLSRNFTIKIDAQEIVTIPKGTEILMIFNNNYYTYIAEQDISEIPLSYFKDNSGQVFSGEFSSLRNVEGVQKDYNEITGSTTYRYDETYRFIVSFMNVENPITNGTYYSMINVNDAGEWIDEGQLEGANIVQIQNREYDYDYQLDRQEYEANGIININGELNLSETTNTDGSLKDLIAIIGLNDNQGNLIGIPEGTIIAINNNNYEVYNGIAETKIIEELLNGKILQDLDIKVDMSSVLPQNRLGNGKYNLKLELVLAKNDVLERNIQEVLEIPITIENIDKSTYGLKAQILNIDAEMLEDKLQLIQKGNNEERTINLQYVGNINEANVKIKVLERTSEFTYEETDNSEKITTKVNDILVNEITTLEAEQMILVNFPDNIKSGTYRVVFELNNKYGDSKTECLANFIVAE